MVQFLGKNLHDNQKDIANDKNKNKTKNGIYRKSKKLVDANMKWLVYMLEETGFIRKPKLYE